MKSPTVTVRMNPLLLAAMRAEIERFNDNPTNEAHDVTSFINQAVSEKIAHLERSRQKRPRKVVAKSGV